MRRFNVKVNGKQYEVEIEEIFDSEVTEVPSSVAVPVNGEAAASEDVGNIAVRSPIQGNVVKVDVSHGIAVTKGQRLCVIEAMKMEYDIVAPETGVIATVDVARGMVAEEGRVLFTIKD